MKKIILMLFFILSLYPEGNINNTSALSESGDHVVMEIMREKIEKLERQIYLTNLIQSIEIESEIIIPTYVDPFYIEYIYDMSTELSIPIRTSFRLVWKESTFRVNVTSRKGANGLMQLMPTTRNMYYNDLRVDTLGLDKNQEDIYIGLYMLKELQVYWKRKDNSNIYSWKLSLASYNAGLGNVIKYNGIPPYKETIDYVNFISKSHNNPKLFKRYSRKYQNTFKPIS